VPIAGDGPFCLTTDFLPYQREDARMRYLLVRELGRQAVLIAARDGIGLTTRDETLGESFPDEAADRFGPFDLDFGAYNAGNASLRLRFATHGDVAAIDKLLDGFVAWSRCNYCYFLGEQLALHGDQPRAEQYWRRAVTSGQFESYNVTFAGQRLVERHGTSRPDEDAESHDRDDTDAASADAVGNDAVGNADASAEIEKAAAEAAEQSL